MKTDVECWLDFGERLGIEIVAPFNLELNGAQTHFTALFPQFGAPAGMVVDADWNVIAPHRHKLLAAGYGFSCLSPGEASGDISDGIEMLLDWGWTSVTPKTGLARSLMTAMVESGH